MATPNLDPSRLGPVLKRLRLAADMTQQQVAEQVGCSWGTIQRLESGKRPPSDLVLAGYARAFRVDLDALIRYEVVEAGAMRGNGMERPPGALSLARQVPIVNSVPAGIGANMLDDWPVGVTDEVISLPASVVSDPHAFGLRLRGQSLEPVYHDGDIAVVCPSQEHHPGKLAVFRTNTDDCTCKYCRESGDNLVFWGGPSFPPETCRLADLKWLYPVQLVMVMQ